MERVHNLAETSASMGQYDQAITYYMRALDLRRSMRRPGDAAIESYSLGTLFGYQGRFGAAMNSKQDALKTFPRHQGQDFLDGQDAGGFGEALRPGGARRRGQALLGRSAQPVARTEERWHGAADPGRPGRYVLLSGDFKSARASYEQALQAATRSKEPDTILIAKINIAKVAIQEGHGQQAISSLGLLRQQADDLGLKQTSVQCSIEMAEAMAQKHDNAHAQQELERAIAWVDKVGLKPLSVQAHYQLATVLRSSGQQGEAQQHYGSTLQLLDEMRKEPGGEKILQRPDLKTMYDEATRWSQAAKN